MNIPQTIKPDSPFGRILLAMRPGLIGYSELSERLGSISNYLTKLTAAGLVEIVDGGYQLTNAGRAACPNRRDAQPSPLHASKSNMARQHGWSSAHKSKEAAR